MRDYGKVYTAFWTSEDTRNLSEDGRILAIYLLTCTHGNMLGCFRLTDAYAADDLKWGIERVSKGFEELYTNGFSYRCNKTFWVFIRQYLKWNQFENPNVGMAAGKLFDALPIPTSVKPLLALALRENCPRFPMVKLDEFERYLEPFANPFTLISKTVVGVVVGATAPTEAVTAAPEETSCDGASATPQKKVSPIKPESETASTWNSYSDAYFDRYGAEPVRNATVNGQLANFVRRLGRDESPHVARFFVGHNNAYYVREMHSIGAMVKDSEKLRTEWATNCKMTQTKALQADKTQTNFDAFAPLIAEAEAREKANG
jgi:hypothetical protein